MNRLKITLVAAVALASTVNVFNANKSETVSDMALADMEALANVEALANEDDTGAGSPCYKGSYNSNFPEATKCAKPCIKERCGGTIDKCY